GADQAGGGFGQQGQENGLARVGTHGATGLKNAGIQFAQDVFDQTGEKRRRAHDQRWDGAGHAQRRAGDQPRERNKYDQQDNERYRTQDVHDHGQALVGGLVLQRLAVGAQEQVNTYW